MKAGQLLAVCLLACIACAIADEYKSGDYTKPPTPPSSSYKDGEYKDGSYKPTPPPSYKDGEYKNGEYKNGEYKPTPPPSYKDGEYKDSYDKKDEYYGKDGDKYSKDKYDKKDEYYGKDGDKYGNENYDKKDEYYGKDGDKYGKDKYDKKDEYYGKDGDKYYGKDGDKYYGKDSYDKKDEYYGKDGDKYYGKDSYDKGPYDYERDYYENNYGDYDEYSRKPSCGPDRFDELKGATCLDPHSGECVPLHHCTIGDKYWCKQVPKTKWGCKYDYKPKDVKCRDKNGVCDKTDYCTGKSASCPQTVEKKDTVCKKSDKVCMLDAVCDGVQTYCGNQWPAATGTPCNKDGHDWEEASDDHGKMALMSDSSAEALAKKHGWAKCQRCYDGECKSFEYKWWKKEHKRKHEHEHEAKEEEYYPTKSDKGEGKTGTFEPEFFCKRSD